MSDIIRLPKLFRRLTARAVPAEVKPWQRRYDIEPRRQLSPRTFARLILIHCQNARVKP